MMLRKCLETLQKNHVPKTDDSFKYKYIHDGDSYQFPTIDSKIVALIINGTICQLLHVHLVSILHK